MVNKCPYRRRQSEVNILGHPVVICFQISIFEPLKTAYHDTHIHDTSL